MIVTKSLLQYEEYNNKIAFILVFLFFLIICALLLFFFFFLTSNCMLRQTYQRGHRASMICSRAYTQVNFHPRIFKKIMYTFTDFNTTQNNSPQYCDFAVSLSGFIYLRNKQGTEYCKITAHISNGSPLVF